MSREGLLKDGISEMQADEVLVIDAKRTVAGILGFNNTLGMRAAGAAGFVIDGCCRDSTECMN